VGGAVICATKELHDTIKHMQNVHGNIMSPQNAFYTLQTSKTLGLRIQRQSETAQKELADRYARKLSWYA